MQAIAYQRLHQRQADSVRTRRACRMMRAAGNAPPLEPERPDLVSQLPHPIVTAGEPNRVDQEVAGRISSDVARARWPPPTLIAANEKDSEAESRAKASHSARPRASEM